MHPWKNVIIGKTEELETKACFICLERIPCSDGDMEDVKQHIINVHSAKTHLEELVEMCIEAEAKEEREGWIIDDILEELRDKRESQERKRAESGGWMFRKKKMPEFFNNNEEAENKEVECFFCQQKLIVKTCEYRKHLEKQHGVIFGVKEIMKVGEEPQVMNTDADIVKELVEMKFLKNKRKIRLNSQRQRFCTKNTEPMNQ